MTGVIEKYAFFSSKLKYNRGVFKIPPTSKMVALHKNEIFH